MKGRLFNSVSRLVLGHGFFFVKGILLIAVLGFSVNLISPYLSYKQDCRMTQNLSEFEDEIDESGGPEVCFFSTHLLATNVEPMWFEHRTGLSCRHFGGVGYSVPLNIEICKHVVARHKPKCVVFDIGPMASGLAEAVSTELEIMALTPLSPSISKVHYLNSLTRDSVSQRDFMNGFSEYTSAVYSMNEWNEFVNERPHYNLCKGFEPRNQRPLIREMSDEEFVQIYSNVEKATSYFQNGGSVIFMNYIKELADAGIKVVLLESIRLNSGGKENLEKLKNSFESLSPNIHVISMDGPDAKRKMNFNRSHFSDYECLTVRGSILASDYLATCMDGHLDFIDPNEVDCVIEKELMCTRSKMIVTNEGDQVLQLYFDEKPEKSSNYQALLKIYPTSEDGSMLSELSKKNNRDHDVVFFNFSELKKVGDEYMLHMSTAYWTKIKKPNISEIKLQFYTHHLTEETTVYPVE